MSSVLHVITGLSGGGAERTLFNVVRGTKDRYETRVISLTDEGIYCQPLRDMGVFVECLRLGKFQWSLKPFCRALKKFRPSVIQGWMYHGNLAACMIGSILPGRRAVLWNVRHSLYDLRREKPLTRQVIRLNRSLSSGADAVIYNSNVARRQHEEFGFCSERSLVIPNGFDLSQWGHDEGGESLSRQSLGLPDDALVVGHVARFHPMKDHEMFVRSTVELMQRYPRIYALLAGKGVDQKNLVLNRLIPEGVRQRFLLLGERSDVPALMRVMDVFCLSSRWGEAFPNVLGEAMASGLPSVVTNVGDCAEILGEGGIVVPPGDESEFLGALERMISMPEPERERLGRKARNRIENNYNLEAIVNRYFEFYGYFSAPGR